MSPQHADRRKGTIDWPLVLAGAGAAVTVAVLLSTLGAAGTLVGAALGSVTATVSTAVYKQGIEASRRRVAAAAQAVALERVGLAQEQVRRAAAHTDSPTVGTDLAQADALLEQASSDVAPAPVVDQPPARWALPWGRLAVLATAVFVLALLLISGVELAMGRSVSSLLGGSNDRRTSVTEVFGGDGNSGNNGDTGTPAPATPTVTVTTTATVPTSTPTSTASTSPSSTATTTTSVTPTPSSTAPATPPTTVATAAPTASPTP